MDRQHFLWELQARLEGRISRDALVEVLAYYNDCFDDAGPEREAEVIAGLGSPAQLARKILGESALRDLEGRQPGRSKLKTLLIVLAAILASPIAIPISLTVLILALTLVLVVFVCVAAVGIAAVCCIGAGVGVAVMGFGLVLDNWAASVFHLGGGLMAVGAGLLLMAATMALASLCVGGIARLAGRVLRRKEGGK